MEPHQGGNAVPEITRETHDHTLGAQRVNLVGTPTLYAVVNTGAAGIATVVVGNPTLYAVVNTAVAGQASVVIDGPVEIKGNVTLSDSKTYIGLTSVSGSVGITGNVTLSDSKSYIGLTSVSGTVGLAAGVAGIGFATINVVNQPALVAGAAYIGLVTVANTVPVTGTFYQSTQPVSFGNVTLSSSVNSIGFATVNIVNQPALVAGTANIGCVTLLNQPALTAGVAGIGFATVNVANSVGIVGNVTISDSKGYIGLVSVSHAAWADPKTYIGLATVVIGSGATIFAVVNTAAAGQSSVVLDTGTKNIGSVSVLGGGIGLNAGVNSFGFATVVNTTGTANIGSVSVLGGGIGLNAGVNWAGFMTVSQINQPALVAGAANIGCVTLLNQPALTAGVAYAGFMTVVSAAGIAGIGFATVNVAAIAAGVNSIGFATVQVASIAAGINAIGFSTVYNAAGTQFIGLVTAYALIAGTTKTLQTLPIGFQAASIATLAVPTNAAVVKLTNVMITSDATTTLRLKSGVTYLTGNASIGVNLIPGSGFVLSGSPDSPSWIGCPSGALIIEKFDTTATSAKIAGVLTYFSE